MVELPLTLEPTAHYLFLALPLGGGPIVFVAYMLWRARQRGWAGMGLRQWLAFAVLAGIGAAVLVQPVAWQLRLDRQGIVLRAPFDPFGSHGRIGWDELQDIRFGSSGGRGNQPTLKFVGRSGTILVLQALDGVPDAYWPALVSVVEANAPGFRFSPDSENWLAEARAVARPTPGALGGWIYAVDRR